MNKESAYIKIENVSKKMKKRVILSNISIAFDKGKIYGIVGANGSGKTMLFRAMAGLLHLDEGHVIFSQDGISMGVIIENPGFLLSYTGYDNLKLLAQIRNVIGKSEICSAMERVGLEPYDKRKVKEYSLGMKQRLAVAQAIMEAPDILILDEPFRGMDEESNKKIRSILVESSRSGTTIFLSSHNSDDISAICDKVFEMREGQLFDA